MRKTNRSILCGASRVEVVAGLTVAIVILAIAIPSLAGVRQASYGKRSAVNLMTLGASHVIYAADWNGRQFTNAEDDLASYGDDQSSAFFFYEVENGEWPSPLVLGWGTLPNGTVVLYQYLTSLFEANRTFSQPIVFDGPVDFVEGLGYFRIPNAKAFHDYVGGRFYDPLFYAPADVIAYDTASPAFDAPDEFVYLQFDSPIGDIPAWSSYCLSAAALFDPAVLRPEPAGGYQDPYSVDDAFTAPGLFQAMHPSLKTFMLEHNWNDMPRADPCIPEYPTPTFNGCEPYYFTHGLAAAPVTLFYDLHVRPLPNTEVIAADAQVMSETGFGLWSRDTSFGANGYYGEYAFDAPPLGHHVLTTSGILGRDTTAGAASSPPPPTTSAWRPRDVH